jgi:inner membrane protein
MVGLCGSALIARWQPEWLTPSWPVEAGWLQLRPLVESFASWTLGFFDGAVRLWVASGLAPLVEQPVAYLLLIGVIVVASLLPDIDHQSSRINQVLGTSRGLIGWLVFRFFKIFIGSHRTVTHYGVTWLLLSLVVGIGLPLLWSPGPPYAVAFSIGYGLHIAADMLTDRGVPVFGPVNRRRYTLVPGLLTFPTGTWREYATVLGLVVLTVWVWGLGDFVGSWVS